MTRRQTIALVVSLFAIACVLYIRAVGTETAPQDPSSTFWVQPALPAPSVQFGFTYTVPPGVVVRVMDPTEYWDNFAVPPCIGWPGTPTQLPCVEEIHANATNDGGATATAVQRWMYTAPQPPSPSPSALPACRWNQYIGNPAQCICGGKISKNGRCR